MQFNLLEEGRAIDGMSLSFNIPWLSRLFMAWFGGTKNCSCSRPNATIDSFLY